MVIALKEDWSRSSNGTDHPPEHNVIARILNFRRYGFRHASLQAVVNEAIASKRPIELEPGRTYDLSEPLVVSNVRRFNLIANGAQLRATADMPYLLDLNGVADSAISDLDLTTANGVTVTSMVRYRWADGVARSSTRNRFEGIHISGRYVNGWHVGDGARQVDISEWRLCTCQGQWAAGESALWQTGYLMGDGANGNGMLTTFGTCSSYYHRNHWRINGYRYVQIGPGCNGSFAECDIVSNATRPVSVDGYRSEHAGMLFKGDAAHATFPMMQTIRNVGFHTTPEDMGDNRAIVDVNYGGVLTLENVTTTGTAAGSKLIRSHDLNRPLHVDVTGAVLEGVAPGDAFDLDANTTLRTFGVQQINAQGGIVE